MRGFIINGGSLPLDEEERLILGDISADSSDDVVMQEKPRLQWQNIDSAQHHFIPSLEGLRGLAVLMTQISHAGDQSVLSRTILGPMGVDIFFVLSGFLITGVLLRFQKVEAGISYRFLPRFYADRAVRLLPALITLVIIGGAIALSRGLSFSILAWYSFLALFYLSNFSSLWTDGFGPFGNTWSLAVEEHFYLLWSILLPIISRLSLFKRGFVLASIFVLSFGLRIYVSMYPGSFFGLDYYFSSLPNFWKMIMGASMQLLPIPVCLFQRKFAYFGLMGLLSILLFAQFATQPDYSAMAPGWKDEGMAGYRSWSDILSCFYTMIIIISVHGKDCGNALLENRSVRFMGKISYAWYLWQMPMLVWFGGFQQNNPLSWGNTSSALIIAMASTFLIESPISKRYRDWKEKGSIL